MAEKSILSGQLSSREIALAAYNAGMMDCTRAEISRYAIYLLSGMSPENAKREALSTRKTVKDQIDRVNDTVDIPISVQVSTEQLKAAREKLPDATPATLFRYALLALSYGDPLVALEAAQRSHGGGWTKGKPRK